VSSVLPFPLLVQPNPRNVLTQELARLEKQYQALEQEIVLLLSQTGTAEYGAAPKNQNRVAALQLDMARTEREIEALQREWDRVSKTPMQAVSPVGKP
jgi:predicted  nucleic acid-binding Zn-ribbon protein